MDSVSGHRDVLGEVVLLSKLLVPEVNRYKDAHGEIESEEVSEGLDNEGSLILRRDFVHEGKSPIFFNQNQWNASVM